MTTNEDLHELTAAYALDALDADERSAYEAHLAECDRCRADLRDLGETVGALALAAEGSAPPDALRDRILVAARDEGPSNVVSIGSGRRRRWYAVTAAAAVAAVGLAIGLTLALSGGGSSTDKLAASVSVDNGVAELTVSGLPDAPAGKAYEIWVIEGKTAPKPAGLFTDTGEPVALTRPAPAGATVAVTLEQAAGSETPTPPIRVSTTVPA
jgi:anti-sigma-K factor RskA